MTASTSTRENEDDPERDQSRQGKPKRSDPEQRGTQEWVDDVLGHFEALHICAPTPHEVGSDGAHADLQRAYCELCLVVADQLAPEKKGGLSTSGLYASLSSFSRRVLQPSRGGVGITNLPNSAGGLRIKGRKYEKTEYHAGEETLRIYSTLPRWEGVPNGDGQIAGLAEAAHEAVQTGCPDKVEAGYSGQTQNEKPANQKAKAENENEDASRAHAPAPTNGDRQREGPKAQEPSAQGPATQEGPGQRLGGPERPPRAHGPSRLNLPTGIEPFPLIKETGKNGLQLLQTPKNGPSWPDLQKARAVIPACKKVDTGSSTSSKSSSSSPSSFFSPPILARRALQRSTCERETREAIFRHVPEAGSDAVLFRWVAYALWTTWRDRTTRRRVLHHEILHWIGHHRFTTAEAVLEHVQDRLRDMDYSDTWAPGSHTRQILDDGLPPRLWKTVKADLRTPPSEQEDRVYVLSGKRARTENASEIRTQLKEEAEAAQAPSPTASRIQTRMNEVSPQNFSCFTKRIEQAFDYARRMQIDAQVSPLVRSKCRSFAGCEKNDDDGTLTGNVARYEARVRHERRKLAEEQRDYYLKVLRHIAHQHKPFYTFSRQERTDRIFPLNESALLLPKEIRSILCQGFYEVDLKSAHLFIAAWLWDATEALETLTQKGYSIWTDLMEHCRSQFEEQGHRQLPEEGTKLYKTVKGGMKVMVYSTVYGMPAASMQAQVTKSLQHVLGREVGSNLREHPVISRLLAKRDQKLAAMQPGDVLEGPTGIETLVKKELGEDGENVGPKSALSTLAQSYEQELMSVLLEVAENRDPFHPLLWLHDGAVCKARYPNALEAGVNEALDKKREELTAFAGKDETLPSVFEVERIEPPSFPPKNVHDRIAAEGRGAIRLKEGETAVRVAEDGQELKQVDSTTLIRTEHELYRIAGDYVRLTGEGYEVVSDPYPEEKLWQPLAEQEKCKQATSAEKKQKSFGSEAADAQRSSAKESSIKERPSRQAISLSSDRDGSLEDAGFAEGKTRGED